MRLVHRSGNFVALGLLLFACAGLFGCSETVPSGLLEAVESIDRDLVLLHAAEMSPDDYARFAHQWMALKARAEAEEDAIHWPWEQNDLEQALRRLEEEGVRTVAHLTERRESLRRSAEEQLTQVQDRFQILTSRVGTIDSRLVLGRKPVETDLWITQARSFYEQGQYEHSLHASEQAAQRIAEQALVLSRELGRYADRERITRWQEMAKDTVEWSRKHQASAIVVSKADRLLTLYRNGKRVLSYPVRLGFNGIREKLYQGDGATPEGRYRVAGKRGQGQTQFYRALVLNYPNADDRKRFLLGRKAGNIPRSRSIGGQIEIHGIENELMAQTLGCIMLDNSQMALLFTHVEKGTPVTIVGALQKDNSVALVLADLSVRTNEI
ncbi:MAG TPA: L,D-transpeptidase [Nitrospira sp.]|nr:L,D-transpeptidase [Nitrospira sp.]